MATFYARLMEEMRRLDLEVRIRTTPNEVVDAPEFILPYEVVRQAASPDDTLLAFLQTPYEAAAGLAKWDRPSLEREP